MTRLLVSVRSASEAEDALAGGADLIDVKEPSRGSLGMADPVVWREVADAVSDRAPLSAALGELRDFRGRPPNFSTVQFAKLGLAGGAANDDWPTRWAQALGELPSHVQRVAVSYADWRFAEAPPPGEVIEVGANLGCKVWLIDTYGKNGDGLLDYVSPDELAVFIGLARRAGMLTVVAGSLTLKTISAIIPLLTDYIAVRGAACRGGRAGVVDPQLVRDLATQLRSSA